MALRKPVIHTKKVGQLRRSPSKAQSHVDQAISLAVEKAQVGEVVHAVDYLEEKAANSPKEVSVKLLLAAAQLVDSTNPQRAKSMLQRVLEIDSNCGPAHLGLAVVYSNLGDPLSSIKNLRDAILLPLTSAQKILASLMLSKCGLLAPALDMAKKAFYELGRPIGQASNCLDIALQVADWDFAEELIDILRKAHKEGQTFEANEATKTHILWCDDEPTNIAVIKAWSCRTFPDVKEVSRSISQNPVGRRIRVGYLSSDFRHHPTAWLINGLFRNHDKSKFELFLYCSGWDDGSEIRREVLSHFENVHTVTELSDTAAAELISSHNLDILVELNGPTKANRMGILAQRPAPIQICYLGWPGSVGGRFVDYIFADSYILPENQAKLYPEKIIWLSDTYQVNDYSAYSLPNTPSREELGFADDVIIVGMFNTINKSRREVWSAWMEIIKSAPNAVFWILDPGPDARENLAVETLAAGVDLERIVIAPKLSQLDHLARLQVCDLILDPWPVGGHTSTADALYARVPLVAMQGKSYSSRVSAGLLTSTGLSHLACVNKDEYIETAKALLKDPFFLKETKSVMRKVLGSANLFNSRNKTREIELAFATLAGEKFSQS